MIQIRLILKGLLIYLTGCILLLNRFPLISYSNPYGTYSDTEQVGLYPVNSSYNISMNYATVFFDIDATAYEENFLVGFEGKYTFYNPDDEKNITIVAPFYDRTYRYYWHVNETMQVEVNGIQIQAYFLNTTPISSPKRVDFLKDLGIYQEFYGVNWLPTFFIASNVTFKGHSSTELKYLWKATVNKWTSDLSVSFYYVVGTSRTWSGTVRELVHFKIKGYQPDEFNHNYYERIKKQCKVTEFTGGKSYMWFWDDEIIQDEVVGIKYYFDYNLEPNPMLTRTAIILGSIVIGCLVIFFILRRKLKRFY